jgi:hypothetical protein
MPDMNDLANLMKYDAEKDAMVYHAEIDVLINGQVFTVGIDLLSDENGMGIYAYSFK